jgi:hypothetical protein
MSNMLPPSLGQNAVTCQQIFELSNITKIDSTRQKNCFRFLNNTLRRFLLDDSNYSMGITRTNRWNRWFFIAKLIVRSTCFGHNYANHQELKSIIQVVAACGTLYFGLQVVGLVWSCRLCVRFAGYCSTPDQQLVNQITKYHRQQPPV